MVQNPVSRHTEHFLSGVAMYPALHTTLLKINLIHYLKRGLMISYLSNRLLHLLCPRFSNHFILINNKREQDQPWTNLRENCTIPFGVKRENNYTQLSHTDELINWKFYLYVRMGI